MCRDADEELVQHGREDEDSDGGLTRRPAATDERGEDVALHELVDGLVPGAPIGADAGGVPPVGVEVAVAEAGDLGEGVEEGLEEGEESGEPDYEGDCGELHESLEDGDYLQRGHLVERVAQQRRGILRARDPDEDAQPEDLGESLGDEGPTDAWGAGVYGLVNEGWRPPEIAEVREGDILRIRALRVDVWQGVFDALGGVQVGVPQIAVCEGIGGSLEPDDNGVDFGEGAD